MPRHVSTLLFAVAALQAACHDATGPRTLDPRRGLGMHISDSQENVVGRPIWSPDGSEVYYFTSACTRVVYVLATGQRRTLNDEAYTSPESPYCNELGVSVDSAHLYFAGHGSYGSRRLYRVARAGGPLELIDDSVEAAVASLGTARIAYERGAFCGWPCFGDLWVYEVSSGSRRRLGTGHPVIFSPDGSELLVTQPSSATEIVSVADGTSRVVQPGLSEAAPSAVRWEADGIRELFGVTTNSAVAELWIRNLATGENRKVYEWRGAAWPTGHAWAPDGSRFVVWLRECEPEPYQTYDWGCPSREALYLVDPATGRDTWIVGGDGGHVGDAAVFSPDAKRIAYIFGALRLTSMP